MCVYIESLSQVDPKYVVRLRSVVSFTMYIFLTDYCHRILNDVTVQVVLLPSLAGSVQEESSTGFQAFSGQGKALRVKKKKK